MNRDAKTLLAQLELDVDPRTPVARLRVGAQQVVEIAKAISFDARVIIMDEPTSAITEQEIEVLFRLDPAAQAARRRHHLHHAQARRTAAHRRRRDGAPRRPVHRQRAVREPYARARSIRLMVGRDLAELFPKSAALSARGPARSARFAAASASGPATSSCTTCPSRCDAAKWSDCSG